MFLSNCLALYSLRRPTIAVEIDSVLYRTANFNPREFKAKQMQADVSRVSDMHSTRIPRAMSQRSVAVGDSNSGSQSYENLNVCIIFRCASNIHAVRILSHAIMQNGPNDMK